MHVLLLNQYYPPDTAATARMAAHVVDALSARHRVTVLAGRPSYDPSVYHRPYLFRHDTYGQVVVERVGSTDFPRRRMRRRVANYLTYLSLALPRALMIKSDVVLAMTDPPVMGILGAMVARLRGIPFVYNIRDLYPDMAIAGRIVRPGSWVEKWEYLHRWALRSANRIIVLGEDMRERIIGKGIDPGRVVVVRDGTMDLNRCDPMDHPAVLDVRCGFPFVVLHAGNLGFYGAWDTLLAASRLLEGDGVGFVFVGDGADRCRLEASANTCRSVRFLPYRPANQVQYVLAAGDLHVVTVKRELAGVVVPSKLYPILAAGRPVLSVAPEECDVSRIVRRGQCGVIGDPDDPESVASAIRMVFQDRNALARMSQQAKAIAPEYDMRIQLQQFVKVLENLSA